jgi:hypothetical protein
MGKVLIRYYDEEELREYGRWVDEDLKRELAEL